MPNFVRRSNPASLPGSQVNAVSATANLFATANQALPYAAVYHKSGSTRFANNPSTGANPGTAIAIHPNEKLLFLGQGGSPGQAVFRINEDETFTALPNLSSFDGRAAGAAFSADGTLLAIAHERSPYLTCYAVDAENETFTRIPNPTTLPPGLGRGVAVSHDGSLVAIAHNTSPFFSVYSFNGSTLTKLANPETLPPNIAFGVDFSRDNRFVAVANISTAPYFSLYEIDGSTLTKVDDTPSFTGNGYSVRFDPIEDGLVTAHLGSPIYRHYTIDENGEMTAGEEIPNQPAISTTSGAMQFSFDGSLLLMGISATPFVAIYDVIRDIPGGDKLVMGETLVDALYIGEDQADAAYFGTTKVFG